MKSLTQERAAGRPWRAALLPLMAALVLVGCATAPSGLPAYDTPAQFREQAAGPTAQAPAEGQWTRATPAEAQPRGEWWRAFGDPVLDGLVERAAANNTSIQAAAARLAEARAVLRGTDAERAPQIGAGAGAVRQAGLGSTGSTKPATLLSAGVDFSYELDLFGRLSRASDAARLDAESREGLLQSTRLLVQAETAQTYLALRALDDERALVRQTVDAYRDTLRLVQRRHEAGDLAELDVARVETEMASNESDALTLDRRRADLEHALAVLTGETATSFTLKVDAWSTALPAIPAGVPATVLTRRPDVAAAQKSVLAAQARVGVAQAAWFPSMTLTGNGGYASSDLGDLFKWSARSWGIGALLSLPLFDGGRRDAGIQGASAQLDGVLADYRAQVLGAFKDVEDQLASLRILEQQSEVQARAVNSASRATTLSDSRYRNGLVSQIELLDARRQELQNRRQALQVRAARYQATVALIRAIGGSWDVPVADAGTTTTKVAQR